MKREDLQKLELIDEQIDKVMKLHGVDIQEEQKAKEALEILTTEHYGFKEQIAQRDKDLKAIKKSAADSEELTTKLNDLQSKYDTDAATLNQQLESTKLNAALTAGLAGSGARDIADIQRFLKSDELKLGVQATSISMRRSRSSFATSLTRRVRSRPTPITLSSSLRCAKSTTSRRRSMMATARLGSRPTTGAVETTADQITWIQSVTWQALAFRKRSSPLTSSPARLALR